MRILFYVLLFVASSISAQNEAKKSIEQPKKGDQFLTVQWFGWTYHPGGGAVKMVKHYPLKLDPKAYFVINPGIEAKYDYQLSKRFFLRGSGAYYLDCAVVPAFFVHVGVHFQPIRLGRHSFNFGIGPVLSMREDWHQFEPDYKDYDFYGKRVWRGWQGRFVWYGGEMEYNFQINNRLTFQYSVAPGYPGFIASSVGLRYKFKTAKLEIR